MTTRQRNSIWSSSNRMWNVYSDVATQGTILTEGTALPVTNFVITQGTMQITEAG